MKKFNKTDSVEIQMDVLESRYPKVKELFGENEELLSAADRKPLRFTGLLCIIVGGFFAVQIIAYFLMLSPQGAIPMLIASLVCVWIGARIAFLVRSECVFITDEKIVHLRIDLAGRLVRKPKSIPISEISGVSLYRNTLLFQAFMKKDGKANGDILIRKKNGRSYLLPALKGSEAMSEVLMAEVSKSEARMDLASENEE